LNETYLLIINANNFYPLWTSQNRW